MTGWCWWIRRCFQISEKVAAMFLGTPIPGHTGSMLSDKNEGSFKMEIAWVKAEITGSTE